MRTGHTLVELATLLLILAVAVGSAAPPVLALRDRSAAVSAREAVAALLAEGRIEAVERGGATVAIGGPPWRAWLEVGAGPAPSRVVDLEVDFGVDVYLARAKDSTRIAFDALGLGRVASETVRFRRGDAEAVLVVSGYGRVRRR